MTDWAAPLPPSDESEGYVVAVDPRVIPAHATGNGVPCVQNPPPPVGWAYWSTQPVSPAVQAFASAIEGDPTTYPMGSFVQAVLDGQLVAARVEWHSTVGATGATGCYRGTNLMVAQTAGGPSAVPPPQSTDWGIVAVTAGILGTTIYLFLKSIKVAGRARG